jgi:protein-S-isoprenylcysteine O-methyltransferase Ste14
VNAVTSIIAILWVVFWVYWLASAFTAKRSVLPKGFWRRQIALRVVIIAVVIILVKEDKARFVFLHDLMFAPNPALDYAGVVLTALGMAFALWARLTIGRNWGMPMSVREEPELVDSGPYRYVRHPIYSGILLALLGTMPIADTFWIVVFVVCAVYFVYAALQEEKLMTRQFPEQYPEYRKHTKMLIPLVF